MRFDVRARMLAWLCAVLLPMVGAGYLALETIDRRLSDRIEIDLENARRLEAARINAGLDAYADDASSLAGGPHVKEFTAGVLAERRAPGSFGQIGGFDGFEIVDATADGPLDALAVAVQHKARTTGSEVLDVRLVGADGDVYGETAGFSWVPFDDDHVAEVVRTGATVFGNAFRNPVGDDRLGVVAPISFDDRVVGALLVEMRLGPIVDLVTTHEGIGDTSEAHVAQPTTDGDAQFITRLRFERDAAFVKTVPRSADQPINWSLESPGGRVVNAPDYRSVPSVLAIETIERTGWGLVVKIDTAEAFAPVQEVRRVVLAAGVVTAVTLLVGYLVFLRPLVRRLRRTAEAARGVADGTHDEPIADQTNDEIGELARGIDTLAADLAADIEKRTRVEDQLRTQATHDELTGLYNRKFAHEAVRDLAEGTGGVFSVLFIDLDGFKTVNDTFGHQIGDEVLRTMAERITGGVDASAVVARWGGDEFVVVLPGVDEDVAARIGRRLADRVAEPVRSSVGRHSIRCSIGRASGVGGSGAGALDLLHAADSEMFEAKQRSKGLKVVSSATLRAIEVALEEERIEAWYQPVLRVSSDRGAQVIGVEALARLRDADGGILPPAEFLPAISDNHLGEALDERVLEIALRDVGEWGRRGLLPDDFSIAVNLCGASSRSASFPDQFARLIHDTGVAAESVIFEISEASLTLDAHVVQRLRSLGARVALDDLGMQNSNVDRIVDLAPDIGKIDRRWLGSPASTISDHERSVLGSLVDLCRTLDVEIIAEGVETAAQLDLLIRVGVEHIQGYFFARPEPADASLVADLDRRAELAVPSVVPG